MSTTLRAVMVFAAFVTVIWILRKIRKFKVKMEDAIFWTFFAFIVLMLAIVPEISFEMSRILGFMSPSNMIFMVIIVLMLEKIFTLSIIVSQLEEKVSVLSSELALRTHSAEKRLDETEQNKEEQFIAEKSKHVKLNESRTIMDVRNERKQKSE